MRDRLAVWRRRLWVWLLPALVVVVGILGLVVYSAAFAGRLDALDATLEEAMADRDALTEARAYVEDALRRADQQTEDIRSLYDESFGLEEDRFVEALVEIRTLARQAGLDPQSFSYPEQELDGYGLVRRDIVFAVEGSYDALRTFMNLLELTDGFFTLEEVALRGQAEKTSVLSIRLTLSTLFIEESDDDGRESSRQRRSRR